MVVLESKATLGKIIVTFDNKSMILDTMFYKTYLEKECLLQEFLQELNWQEIIIQNNHNLIKIKELLLEEYLAHISNTEVIYNKSILDKNKILDAQYNVISALSNYIDMLHLNNKEYAQQVINQFKTDLYTKLDWINYIKTIDYQSEEYLFIKQLFYEKLDEAVIIENPDSGNNQKNRYYIEAIIRVIVVRILYEDVGLYLKKYFLFSISYAKVYKVACFILGRLISEEEINDLIQIIDKTVYFSTGTILPLIALKKLALLLFVITKVNSDFIDD